MEGVIKHEGSRKTGSRETAQQPKVDTEKLQRFRAFGPARDINQHMDQPNERALATIQLR